MNLYLAGPMRGYPQYNFPAFDAATLRLRSLGHEVFSPAERDRAQDGFDPTRDEAKPLREYMRHDLPAVLGADAVAVLPGWTASRGAQLEVTVARTCAIPILDADTLQPWRETACHEAERLVYGERGQSYGHPRDDFTRTGKIWAAILNLSAVSPSQVALCLIALKLSRHIYQPKHDNIVDIAGYAECLYRIEET